MALVTLRDVTLRFRGPPLLDGVECHLEEGQRIGLLGRNGAGKTSLMRLLAGELAADSGSVQFAPGTVVSILRQDVPQDVVATVRDVVAEGWTPAAAAAGQADEEHEAAWRRDHAVAQILSRTGLDGDARFETLSSGMKRRVLLARAIVAAPDLLLLDEPTNHLDIGAIEWLEEFLLGFRGTLLFVTHDRAFLRRLATRILEIDRGRIFDWSCDYDTFLARKQEALDAEEKQNALFDKKLAEEEVWIRTGIKARRTRNEGRVRALEAMRRERSERRDRVGKSNLLIQEAERSGTLVAALEGVSVALGGKPVLRDVTTTVTRGDRVGIIGPNGAGKTTLLRVLLGELVPDTGRARTGTNLQIATFDQLRGSLDDEASVADNVGDGYETVKVGGQSRHVLGYLRDFLFTPERARLPVKFLSGGERGRVLLAKLFAKPANLIVLDEPTNDLDAETLELLEERLAEFGGTVIVVSHDRQFLDNVVTQSLVFEADPSGGYRVHEQAGGYSDWLRRREAREAGRASEAAAKKPQTQAAGTQSAGAPAAAKPRKLSFKEQQELAGLPGLIDSLEKEISAIHAAMAGPDWFKRPGEELAREKARLESLETTLTAAFARWEALEG